MNKKQQFEQHIRQQATMLLTYSRAVTAGASAADDIFQDTLLTAWNKFDQFDRQRDFGAWLRGIARNHALESYRKSKRETTVCDTEVFDYLDQQFSAIDWQAKEATQARLDALSDCIANLPESYRSVVQLRYLDEQKTAQVRQQLALGKEVVKKRLQRAKQQLFECLRSKGVMASRRGESL